jgi:hypothetical protein
MLTPDDIAQITKCVGALDLSIRELTVALKEHTAALQAAAPSAPTSGPTPAYERRTPPGTPAPARKFEGDWREFVIPFGKQAGRTLGSLPTGSLTWWIENYQPKPYNGSPPRPSDLAFRAALDAAKADGGASATKAQAATRSGDLPLEQEQNLINRDGTPAASVDENVPF